VERRTRNVFFDAGGTLIRTRESVGEIYCRRAAEFGVLVSATELENQFRRVFSTAPPLAFAGASPDQLLRHEQAWWRAIMKRVFAGFAFADFESFFHAVYRDFAQPENWEPFPDVEAVLEHLRERKISLGVISNFDSRLVPIFDGLGLTKFFDSVIFSSGAGFAKPDARIFAHALKMHGALAEAAVHVGDSQSEDIEGARAAGMRAVLVRVNGRGLDAVVEAVDVFEPTPRP